MMIRLFKLLLVYPEHLLLSLTFKKLTMHTTYTEKLEAVSIHNSFK